MDYSEHSPWNQRADSGPDAAVPGWFYNLGITGMRARLLAEEPKALRIEYVFPGSPAAGKVMAGDLLVGAGGQIADLRRAQRSVLACRRLGQESHLPGSP